MRYQDSGPWPLIVMAFAILFVVSWCHLPANSTVNVTFGDAVEMLNEDLPAMVLGKEEAVMMKQHLIDTGEYTHAKGFGYFIRTYDAGRAKPPGIDEYYHLTVHMIYVPMIATGFNIGLEYSLKEGKTDQWGNSEVRKVIQYHLDDGDEDLIPNSMLKVEIETHYGTPVKHEITPIDGMEEWRYWVYYWYSTFLNEGMK